MAFTYFFRDMHTLELIINHVVPHISGRSRVHVWDAGCATGHEPYSLAIMLAENMGPFAFKNVCIEATDVDGSNLFEKIITNGVYQEKELKRIPQELFKKYFQPAHEPGYFKIDDTIKARVHYQKHDLLSLKPVGNGFSLILCKNVLLHFQQAERIEVIKMFHRTLAPGGFFATEQTQKIPTEIAGLFESAALNGQLFRKKE